MISAECALQVLREEGCSSEVISHIRAVTEKSVEIARRISENGHEVDIDRVRVGAILHDIGRARTHKVSHGVEGAQILRERGLEDFAPFAENHLGAGITREESEDMDIPDGNYMPKSLEEKIVTYGDNLIRGDEVITFEEAVEELEKDLGSDHSSLKRFSELREELREFGGVD